MITYIYIACTYEHSNLNRTKRKEESQSIFCHMHDKFNSQFEMKVMLFISKNTS